MTKELELLVKKWRDDGIRLNGGADKPYSDDENSVRAFVLEHCAEELAATLAKTQEGEQSAAGERVDWRKELEAILADDSLGSPVDKAWSCLACGAWTPLNHPEAHDHEEGCPAHAEWKRRHDWRVRLQNLIAQQKAPEGEEECETCEGRGWHDERLGGYSFSNPKAPCPDCDGTGQLSDSAAPGGDVEQRASFERWVSKRWGCATEKWADSGEYKSHLTRDWWQCWQAALSAPKQVGVSCAGELLDGLSDTFKGDDLQLLSSARSLLDLDKSGALVPHGIGGHARGIIETFIVRMAYAPQAAPVPEEGEGPIAFVRWLDEGFEIDWLRNHTNGDCYLYTTPPPSQPAVELERRELTSAEIERGWNETFSTNNPFCPCDLKSFGKAVRWAQREIALIDGAKAGKGEGHG